MNSVDKPNFRLLPEQMGTSLFFAAPRTKGVERRPCPTNTHTYTLFSSSFHGRPSPQRSFSDPLPTVFVFFFLPLDTNRLRGESSFRPEPLRKPPYEPFRVDIQFFTIALKKYLTIRLRARVFYEQIVNEAQPSSLLRKVLVEY